VDPDTGDAAMHGGGSAGVRGGGSAVCGLLLFLCCLNSAPSPVAPPPALHHGCSVAQRQISAALLSLRGGGSDEEEMVPLRTKSRLDGKRHARSFPAALMPYALACQSMGIADVPQQESDLRVLLDDWRADRAPHRIPEVQAYPVG